VCAILQKRFLEAPAATAGSLRISFVNMHVASTFKNRFLRVVKPGSPWLSAHPSIHIHEEWSGMWDDADVPQSLHEDNINYVKGRQLTEGNHCHICAIFTTQKVCVELYRTGSYIKQYAASTASVIALVFTLVGVALLSQA
jgi:hypothetical protein